MLLHLVVTALEFVDTAARVFTGYSLSTDGLKVPSLLTNVLVAGALSVPYGPVQKHRDFSWCKTLCSEAKTVLTQKLV